MICQTCGLDKKSRIKMIRLFWQGSRVFIKDEDACALGLQASLTRISAACEPAHLLE